MEHDSKTHQSIKKIIFAAGGTGGHVFPAIALADAMRALDPGLEIAFVGASHGNEANWVKNAGYRFILLDLDFITGASFARKLKNILAIPGVLKKAGAILDGENPDAVIGAGGYVSGPIVLVASRRHIPTAILEQNAIPGLTNRILSRFVDKIYTSFENTCKLPAKKCRCLGNPVRAIATGKNQNGGAPADVWQTSCAGTPVGGDAVRLLIFGGSQGAMALNENIPGALAALPDETRARIAVWHQAGRQKLEKTKQAYEARNLCANIVEFIDDMGAAYRWADLLICRSGATSLAEIQVAGLPSILIPFPFAAHNHQEKNADAMVAIGASVKILNDNIANELPGILSDLIAHPEKLSQMGENARKAAKPDAAANIARDFLGL